MKIAVVGIDFPLGKRNLADERMEKLSSIFQVPKLTQIQIDFEDNQRIKEADGILCETDSKLDLILSDLEIIENKLAMDAQNDLLLRCKKALEKETILAEVPFADEEKKILLNFNLVTLKPITFVDRENLGSFPEIIYQVYKNCGMISFFTVNERELRAWSIKSGTTIYEASGLIHSDIQRGFIKAEIVGYEDIIKCAGLNQARSGGFVKVEGKEYIVKDGDLIQIRFNV